MSEEEYEELKEVYGTYVVGGRWANALGWEWREQVSLNGSGRAFAGRERAG